MKLVRINIEDAHKLWNMQVEAFRDLYQKYQDTETSPATENIDKIITRLRQPFSYYYYIQENGETIGAVRVVDKKDIPNFYHATISKSGHGSKSDSCS